MFRRPEDFAGHLSWLCELALCCRPHQLVVLDVSAATGRRAGDRRAFHRLHVALSASLIVFLSDINMSLKALSLEFESHSQSVGETNSDGGWIRARSSEAPFFKRPSLQSTELN